MNKDTISDLLCDARDVRESLRVTFWGGNLLNLPKDNDGTETTIGDCLDNIIEALEENEKSEALDPDVINITWTSQDIIDHARDGMDIDLTIEQAREALRRVGDCHDAEYGINWETITEAVEYVTYEDRGGREYVSPDEHLSNAFCDAVKNKSWNTEL